MTKIHIDYFMNATATWKEIMMQNYDKQFGGETVPSDCSDSHQPDAWRTEARNEHGLPVFFCASEVKQAGPGLIPLYTSPPQQEWQELTDEEIEWIKGSANRALGYIRVTAAKLKEKNT